MEKNLVPGVSLCEEKCRKRRAEKKFKLHITPLIQDIVMTQSVIHAISYLGNVFLTKNGTWKNQVIYFGPTGCGEDFYLITRNIDNETAIDLIESICEFITKADESYLAGANEHRVGFDLAGAKFMMTRYYVTLATGRRHAASS